MKKSKKMSPLQMVRKYEEGGYVDAPFEDVGESEAWVTPEGSSTENMEHIPIQYMPEDGYTVTYDDVGDPVVTPNDYSEDVLTAIANMAYQQTTPDQTEALLSQLRVLGGDSLNPNFAGSGIDGASSAVGGLSAVQPAEKATLGDNAGFKTVQGGQQPQRGFGSWSELAGMSDEQIKRLQDLGVLRAPDKPLYNSQTGDINWGKLLQLGMVGLGGLASFSGAKKNNAALKDYYGALDQQRADQKKWMADQQALSQMYFVPTSSLPRVGGSFRSPK